MSGLVHRNNALQEKILASNILMGTGNDKTDTVEKRIEDLENGGSGGSTVEVTPLLDEGVHIADINVDGVTSALYAPEGGGTGNVNDVLVDGVSVVNQDGEAEIDLSDKQDKLVVGTNIQIGQDGKTISATDTTYSDFVGATSQQAGTHGLVPAPLVTEKDKFLKGDGTWGEAGGGNVDDVKVNGTSVVDANKVAQIVSYKEVTQAEYDALPDSKNSDGIAYFIKDANLPSRPVIYSPIIYSLEERCVGVWTDGKPLYQKTFVTTYNTVSSSGANVSIAHQISDMDKIVSCDAIAERTSSDIHYQMYHNPDVNSNDKLNIEYIGNTSIQIRIGKNYTGSDITLPIEIRVTLQYTKTTDVPGSGKWAQDGIPAVHYSTDEKVIGTWIDGQPIYEKTIALNGLSASPNQFVSTGIEYDSMNIKMFLGGKLVDSETIPQYYACDVGTKQNQYLAFQHHVGSSARNFNYLIIQYTKTTD